MSCRRFSYRRANLQHEVGVVHQLNSAAFHTLQARAALFDILQKQANSSIEELNAGLDALISSAAYLLPDTPEATLAQYAQHYRYMIVWLALFQGIDYPLCSAGGCAAQHACSPLVHCDATAGSYATRCLSSRARRSRPGWRRTWQQCVRS
jgi:hypothetical protein